MNYKKLKMVYGVLLLGGLMFRLISTLYTTEGRTGFLYPGFYVTGVLLSILALLCVATVTAFSLLTETSFLEEIKTNYLCGFFAFAVAVFSVVDILKMQFTDYFPLWQIAIVVMVGIANAAFFVYYAVMCFLKIKIAPVSYIVPLVFCIIKLIRFFAVTSSITIIMDNVFTTLYYAAAVIFMLELAGCANKYTENISSKRLLASGMAASMLAIISALPKIIKHLIDETAALHESSFSLALSIALGLFIMAVTIKNFND